MESEICDSLIKWLDVLNLSSPHSTVEELSDGVALSEALSKIAPEAFDEAWLSKIKRDVGTNWRLKVSNLKKIIEGIFIYFIDVFNLTSTISEDLRPDPIKIAEKCDVFELARLLQLVLGCAVNCLEKQKYITEIMELEEALQRNIMTALQDIEYLWQDSNNGLASRSSIIVSNAVEVKTVLADDREILAQKCHETNKKMLLLIEEKSSMQQEINRLQGQLDKYENPILIGEDCKSIGPIQLGSSRYNDLRKIVEGLKDELLQTETARDDYKMKSMLQEKEIIELQSKMDELHRITIENGQLKDEIDILKEANDKLKIYETQIITFKKKLEDYNDLKKQIKLLEDRNSDYLKQNMQFDDEMKKYCILKGQVDLYKKEIQDLHTKLDNEMSKNIKVEFELNQLQSKVNVTQREKENLIVEIDSLKDLIDELKCGSGNTGAGNTMSKELQSSDLLDRIDRLERENKCLRENQGGQTALSQLLDDSNKREEKLREQLKYANQKVLLLSQNENNNKGENDEQLKPELNEQKSAQLEELISSLHSKISTLESSLMAKENDYIALDNRYKKCVEKAKEVIKTFDPKAITEAIMTDKQDIEIEPSMTVLEERLLATAFYKMGLNLQRDAVDTRLSLAGNAQSFLGRQRQAASRKPSAANFIKK